ncbi:DUF2325 domain-containing protein [Leeia oryzae]|uniref:DUF2325 domain-containing protein n=1 Tax=Leeia oryzae TaxID=356662 RepID=UPI00039D3E68|nr:DUF2325 domain-containing protein [Leeia oryzae]
MNAMVIGADTLGGIPQLLSEHGISIFRHISGRNASHQRKLPTLPKDIDMLILFTDFVGHNVMRHFRLLAHEHNIPMLACRRSSCALMQSLNQCGITNKACQNCIKQQKL